MFNTVDKVAGEEAVLAGYRIEDIDKMHLQIFPADDERIVSEVFQMPFILYLAPRHLFPDWTELAAKTDRKSKKMYEQRYCLTIHQTMKTCRKSRREAKSPSKICVH